jgi:hypothetical protein
VKAQRLFLVGVGLISAYLSGGEEVGDPLFTSIAVIRRHPEEGSVSQLAWRHLAISLADGDSREKISRGLFDEIEEEALRANSEESLTALLQWYRSNPEYWSKDLPSLEVLKLHEDLRGYLRWLASVSPSASAGAESEVLKPGSAFESQTIFDPRFAASIQSLVSLAVANRGKGQVSAFFPEVVKRGLFYDRLFLDADGPSEPNLPQPLIAHQADAQSVSF